ncbi:MAG: hypothetical protein KA004_07695 [Verrucomicrobiales bacterium]|nr:hypothetical protein [Verrucomicrobiales bacterium]
MRYSSFLPLSLAAAALAALGTNAAAQTSTTPTIGFYKFNVPASKSIWVCGFVQKTDFQGQATSSSVSGTDLTVNQTGAGWGINQFNTSTAPDPYSHHVEILDDGTAAHAGMILNVVSNAADSLVAKVPAGFVAGPNPLKYLVRRHNTLGSIFKGGAGTVDGTDSDGMVEFEDTVTLMYANGTSKDFYYDSASVAGGQIVADDQSTNRDGEVVLPGQGMVVTAGGTRVFTFGGGDVSYVKTTPTQVVLNPGVFNLFGQVNPLVGLTSVTSPGTLTGIEKSPLGNFGLQSAGLAPYEEEIKLFGINGGVFTNTGIYYYGDDVNAIVDASGTDVGSAFTDPPANTIPNPNLVAVPNGTGLVIKPNAGPAKVTTIPSVVVGP